MISRVYLAEGKSWVTTVPVYGDVCQPEYLD